VDDLNELKRQRTKLEKFKHRNALMQQQQQEQQQLRQNRPLPLMAIPYDISACDFMSPENFVLSDFPKLPKPEDN
jgi:hypothetical protein